MWPDRVSNPGPPTYESGALPIALRGPAWPNHEVLEAWLENLWRRSLAGESLADDS